MSRSKFVNECINGRLLRVTHMLTTETVSNDDINEALKVVCEMIQSDRRIIISLLVENGAYVYPSDWYGSCINFDYYKSLMKE